MSEQNQSENDLHQLIPEQNPERRTGQRPTADESRSAVEWELTMAMCHITNAISLADNHNGHLLQTARQIIKGVKES